MTKSKKPKSAYESPADAQARVAKQIYKMLRDEKFVALQASEVLTEVWRLVTVCQNHAAENALLADNPEQLYCDEDEEFEPNI